MATPTPLTTSHSYFLRKSDDASHPPISLILRGVNLSSTAKYPTFAEAQNLPPLSESSTRAERDERRRILTGVASHLDDAGGGLWTEAEEGGRDGWFVGRPLMLDEADIHLRRLKASGFTAISGKYDESFIDYTIALLRKCKEHGFKVFISPHQDVFSRFLTGSGAPIWVLLALGLHPGRIHQTGSGVIHSCWKTEGGGGVEGREDAKNGAVGEWPDMIWNTNLHRLAARHCFTMFFASEEFAPKCRIGGKPVGKWLRDLWTEAYGHLAERIAAAGGLVDECVIGWDSMNEPFGGFIGIPNLGEFPPNQEFKKGPSPTPIQGFHLGVGWSVNNIETHDFTSLGPKKNGQTSISPPGGKAVWLTRTEAKEAGERWGWKWDEEWDFWDARGEGGCVWAGHGVWDPVSGEVKKPDYFFKSHSDKSEYDFIEAFWRTHYETYIAKIRSVHPNAISFINPPVFESPPDLSEDVKRGRMALSAHFYDGLTLLAKRRHNFNADAVGLQRGLISMFKAMKFGSSSIRSGLRSQLGELKGDANDSDGIAGGSKDEEYPKERAIWAGEGEEQLHRLQGTCEDGENALSYTIWAYEPYNTHSQGDGWNGEDLSLFSYDDVSGDDDLLVDGPPDLQSLLVLGSRAIESWCRPYPLETVGQVLYFAFDMASTAFELRINVSALNHSYLWQVAEKEGETFEEGETSTLIYVPYVHYRRVSHLTEDEKNRVVGSPVDGEEWVKGQGLVQVDLRIDELSEGKLQATGQWLRWTYPLKKEGDREIRLRIRKW
ncbi:hypothetical protein P7C73_g3500, partial [Tremellales sp. Uapishka_1]